ncbi:unnamed protein product [Lampetra planeri]
MWRAQFQFVLPVRGTFRDEHNLGVVMEFMPHGSIAGLLERLEPPWSLRFRLLHEVALAMNFLHSLEPQLLHLDLKPQNVLLDEDLHAKVADFGLSKFKKTEASHRSDVNVLGTQEYMPPESLSNINHRPNTAFDVYSYAILIWAVLTREVPYEYAPSDLILLLVPEGQRPDLMKIPKNANVAGIAKYEDLMKLCWDGDQPKRPSFRGQSSNLLLFYITPLRYWRGTGEPMDGPSGALPSFPIHPPHYHPPHVHPDQFNFPAPTHSFTIVGSNLKNTQIGNNNKIYYTDKSKRHASGGNTYSKQDS